MIELPWPPSSLSGHAKGHWRDHASVVRKHRAWALIAARAVALPDVPAAGDIPIRITFTPPTARGDRTNFPNRMKPYIDGIANALGVNDSRFIPTYVFAPPCRPGGVSVEVLPQ